MLDRLPLRLDPVLYAGSGRMISGEIEISKMSRLSALLVDTEGVFDLDLVFDIDTEGVRFAKGRLQGEVRPMCQRCLSAMTVAIDIDLNLAFVKTEAEMMLLPERYDPFLSGNDEVDLKTLVEDEIILALPDVPLHAEDKVCMQTDRNKGKDLGPEPEQKENPFALLAKLKQS